MKTAIEIIDYKIKELEKDLMSSRKELEKCCKCREYIKIKHYSDSVNYNSYLIQCLINLKRDIKLTNQETKTTIEDTKNEI